MFVIRISLFVVYGIINMGSILSKDGTLVNSNWGFMYNFMTCRPVRLYSTFRPVAPYSTFRPAPDPHTPQPSMGQQRLHMSVGDMAAVSATLGPNAPPSAVLAMPSHQPDGFASSPADSPPVGGVLSRASPGDAVKCSSLFGDASMPLPQAPAQPPAPAVPSAPAMHPGAILGLHPPPMRTRATNLASTDGRQSVGRDRRHQ